MPSPAEITYKPLAISSGRKYGLPEGLLPRLIASESSWRVSPPDAGAGAIGIAQFLPSTARELGIDPANPRAAIPAAGQYLSQLIDLEGGDVARGVARYKGYSDLEAGARAPDVLRVAGDSGPLVIDIRPNVPKTGKKSGGDFGGQSNDPSIVEGVSDLPGWLQDIINFLMKKILGLSVWVIGAIIILAAVVAFVVQGKNKAASIVRETLL